MPLSVAKVHKARLDSLIEANRDNEMALTIARECLSAYNDFQEGFRNAFYEEDFPRMASLLDSYRHYAKRLEQQHNVVGSRTKYYSSILEELPVWFTEDLVNSLVVDCHLDNLELFMGGEECTIRIAANPDGSYFHEKKRVDYCLALRSDDKNNWIPLVGLEVKKYCDKTMFGTILETYKSLQIFRPRTFYGFLVEDEARGPEVVLNSPIYRQEFVLCNAKRNKQELNPVDPQSLAYFRGELVHAISDALHVLSKATSGRIATLIYS